jgi:hypothetical protein
MSFLPLQASPYQLDLRQAPEDLWKEVIEAERPAARALGEAGWRSVVEVASARSPLSRSLAHALAASGSHPFAWLYRCSGGRHLPEIRAWAKGMDWPASRLVLLQCLYELSHLGAPWRTPGCSAGVVQTADGLLHVRTLDWNLPEIGSATRIFDLRTRRGHTARVVGLVGQVGLLSAMVPGGYSVTVNWAPPASLPVFFLGPLFALRETVETCATFHEAVNFLRTRRLASSVFYTVCGVKPGEACVIECAKRGLLRHQEKRVRALEDGPLVQTNHYAHPDLEQLNPPEQSLPRSMLEATSRDRARALQEALRGLRARATLDEAMGCLATAPVENGETCQKMVFCPARGEMQVWVRHHAA